MSSKIPFIVGYVSMKSLLSLEEVGNMLSIKIFGGLQFGGKDLEINDEVPAIFIEPEILGLKVILNGYPGFEVGKRFNLSIRSWIVVPELEYEDTRLDNYLFHLLKLILKDVPDIEVLEG